MPVVKVWGFPDDSRLGRQVLEDSVVKAVLSISELGITNPQFVTVICPSEISASTRQEDVVVEVTLTAKPERTAEVRGRLMRAVGMAVATVCPDGMFVEAYPCRSIPPEEYWSTRQ